jgi:Cu-Zn family superoxide dismutase
MRLLALLVGPVLALSLLLAGCAGTWPSDLTSVVVELRNAAGQPVGAAQFTQSGTVVRLVVEARGLSPGLHALHVHAVGRCDPPDFASAGGHFNPLNRQHGALNALGAHAGDLPNLPVAPDGTGRLEGTTEQITLGAGPTSVWDADGSALVIHASADDFKTDPTGNSGARIACGVFVRAPGK